MTRMRRVPQLRPVWMMVSLAAVVSFTGWLAAGAEAAHPGREALDQAFRFASAIETDADGKSQAQRAIVLGYLSNDDLDEAVRRADRIEGWRAGVTYAQLAIRLIEAGRTEQARAILAKAEKVREAVHDWPRPRIASYIAEARSRLGEIDRSREIAEELAADDDQQYAGRSASTIALGHAAAGDFDKAMDELRRVEGKNDVDTAWWRTTGYVELSRQEEFSKKQRLAALEAARASAETITTSRRFPALQGVAEAYKELGRTQEAGEVMALIDEAVEAEARFSPAGAVQLAQIATTWIELGEHARARALLEQAESIVSRGQDIEQPGLFGEVGATYYRLGDERAARRLFDRAFKAAEILANSRPRAMAVAAICRSMGLAGAPLDETTRSRLDALYEGLGPPW